MFDFQNVSLDAKDRAKDLVARLNLREKVGQVNQSLYGFRSYNIVDGEAKLSQDFLDTVAHWGGLGVFYGLHRADPWTERNFANGLNRQQMIELYNEAQRVVIEASRFQIPALFSQEAPHGPVTLDGYLLPVNLAAAASFNPALYAAACRVAGRELKASGVHLALVSMLDVLRDPRWGRSEECYSEDPYLSSVFAAAGVEGYQEEGTAVVAKHFAAQGETVGGVNASAASIGERELREIHVPPMAAAAKAGARGVMAAYNEIDGVFCHANGWLLKDLLRDELGFDGIVMADGIAIDNLNVMTGDPVESAALALDAGVDVSLWDEAFTLLEQSIERHPELLSRLDEACARVLELKFETGVFDQPYLEHESAPVYSIESEPAALDLARESIVLLKNEEASLPLREQDGMKTALIGPHVRDVYTLCGDYTPYLNPERTTSIAKAMAGYSELLVEEGSGIRRPNPEALARAKVIAREADQIVLTLGGSSSRFGESAFMDNGALAGTQGDVDCGEGVDVSDISLSAAQLELFRAMREIATERAVKLIVVIVGGRPYAIEEVAEGADALLNSFYPGPHGGQAIADILYGMPVSGRLPVSLPRSNNQVPAFYNGKASFKPHYSDLADGPLFPFGFGLTYSDFDVLRVEQSASELVEGGLLTFDIEVQNQGAQRSAIVPQLYVRPKFSSRAPRHSELKAFTKQFIDAGERATVRLTLDAEDMKVWTVQREWALEPGPVRIQIKDMGRILYECEIQIR